MAAGNESAAVGASEPRQGELIQIFDNMPEDMRCRLLAIRERVAGTTQPEADQADEEARLQRRAKLLAERRAEYLRNSGLTPEQCDCKIDNYRIFDASQERAVKLVSSFVNHYPAGRQGLMLWGSSGVGKSHLIKATVQLLLEKPDPVKAVYCSCADLHKLGYQDGMEYLLEVLCKARVVALDDMEKAWGKPSAEKLIKMLLEEVDNYGRIRLIASSNYPLNPVPGYRIDDAEGLSYKTEAPEWSYGRVAKAFYWHRVSGPNYRTDNPTVDEWVED